MSKQTTVLALGYGATKTRRWKKWLAFVKHFGPLTAMALLAFATSANAQSFTNVTKSVLNGPRAIKYDLKVCFTESPLTPKAVVQYEITGVSGCGAVDYFFVLQATKSGVNQCVNVPGCPVYANMVIHDDTNHVEFGF